MWRVSQKIHKGSLAFFGKWDKINRIRSDHGSLRAMCPTESVYTFIYYIKIQKGSMDHDENRYRVRIFGCGKDDSY